MQSFLANLDRLAAVERSGLLDLTNTAPFESLVRTAAERLVTPMAFLNVLDDRRQHHVASFGATVPASGSPVEASYCQYVVATDDVLVVTDSLADALVADHPATLDGSVRAYLGVPVRRDGHCLGSFCVVDIRSRLWTDEDLHVLEALARDAIQLTE